MVVLGDSITYSGEYVMDLTCWMRASGWTGSVINLGLPSETASDLTDEENTGHRERHGFPRPAVSERLERVLEKTTPDIVLACYGMNDASRADDDDRFRRFTEGIHRIVDAAKAHGVREVILLTPPVRDDGPGKPQSTADQALERYCRWLLDQRTNGWQVIDLHGPMRTELDRRRIDTPDFRFARDGVHPDGAGHRLMARAIIAAWGGPPDFTPSDAMRPLVQQQLNILRDAWLRETRHTRPGLAQGLPLTEALQKASTLARAIQALPEEAQPDGRGE